MSEKVTGRLGRPTVLSAEEEEIFAERLMVTAEWGFPMTARDLRHLLKGYLYRLGKRTIFANNMPGPDFVEGFMKRHPELTVRKANLIKRSRAAVSHEDVKSFFERLINCFKMK